jgi:uncharacterized protein (DUF1697 family)
MAWCRSEAQDLMPQFVALLRGVNVGGNKRVPMADWRALLQALGCTQVSTLLNSGNAVFTSSGRSGAAHAAAIRKALLEQLGVDVPVVVKSQTELAAIVAGNVLAPAASDPSGLLVAFAPDAAALQSLAGLTTLVKAPEQFHLGPHAAYLNCASGILESAAGTALLGKLGKTVTTRNWTTVLKLAALGSAVPSANT